MLRKLEQLLTQRAAMDALGAYIVRGLGAVSVFLLYTVIAKGLPADQAGYVFMGLAGVAILAPASVVGIQVLSLRLIGVYQLSDDADKIRYLAGRTRWIAACWSATFALAVWAAAPWLADSVFQKPAFREVLRGLAPAIFCTGMSVVIAHQLQGLRRFTSSLFVSSIGTQIGSAVVIWMMPDVTASGAAYIYATAAAGNLVIATILWRRLVGPGHAEPVQVPKLISSCASLWAVTAMVPIVNWSGQLIAGMFVDDPEQVAQLAVAARLANLTNFLLIGANLVVTPRFARHWHQGNTERLQDLALKATALITVLALPPMILLVFAPEFVLGFFGPQYVAAAPLLIILGLSQFFNVMTGSVNQLLSMCGFEHDLRNIVIGSGCLTILLSITLTSMVGVKGTAIAVGVSLAFQNIIAVAMVRWRLGFSMWQAFHIHTWRKALVTSKV